MHKLRSSRTKSQRLISGVAMAMLLIGAGGQISQVAAEEPDPFVSILNQGRVEEARAWLEPRLEESPNDPLLRLYHSMILAIRAPGEAAIYLRQLVNEQPSFAEAHNNLAVILAQQGEYKEALTHAERAIAIRPDYPEAIENLAHLHAWMAASSFDKAIKLSPRNEELKRKLSILVKMFEPLEESSQQQTRSGGPLTSSSREAKSEIDSSIDTAREREVLDALGRWVDAWSNQRIEDYLASYSLAFAPADGRSRDEWQRDRRDRINGKKKIEVKLEKIEVVELESDRAIVRFVQRYRSPSYRDRVTKRIELRDEGESWRIVSEAVD
jgi:tetratricopeptide (TPR) repeat protein